MPSRRASSGILRSRLPCIVADSLSTRLRSRPAPVRRLQRIPTENLRGVMLGRNRRPIALLIFDRQARLDRDRADLNVTTKDMPTIGAFGVRAAGELEHDPLERARSG